MKRAQSVRPNPEEHRREDVHTDDVFADDVSADSHSDQRPGQRGWFSCLAAPVTRLSELSSDPQVIANEYIIEYDDPVLGKQKVVGFPNIFSETPMSLTSLAPECGQHTEEVLLRLGRFAPDDLAKFQKDGVIRQK